MTFSMLENCFYFVFHCLLFSFLMQFYTPSTNEQFAYIYCRSKQNIAIKIMCYATCKRHIQITMVGHETMSVDFRSEIEMQLICL